MYTIEYIRIISYLINKYMKNKNTKTVYSSRNAIFKDINMILCNNITQVDESFIEDNYELFYSTCEDCNGEGEKDGISCAECYGEGRHDCEAYQYFIIDASDYTLERLKDYGINYGHSQLLDLDILPIYDYGTSWSHFSYSKDVDIDYTLAHDETLTRSTVY